MPYYRCPACGSLSHSVAVYSTAGVCAICAAELPDQAKLGDLSESEFGVNRSLRADLAAPRQARHAVATLPLRELARERLALVVSELVTNSIRHAGLAAGDPIELQMTRDNGQVRIAVHDGGPGFDPTDGRERQRAPAVGSASRSSRNWRTSGASIATRTAAPSGAQCGTNELLARARSFPPGRRTRARAVHLTFDPPKPACKRRQLRRRTQRGGGPAGHAPFVSRTAYSPLVLRIEVEELGRDVRLGVDPADERDDLASDQLLDRSGELSFGRVLEEHPRVPQAM